jgi:hypothetical protein
MYSIAPASDEGKGIPRRGGEGAGEGKCVVEFWNGNMTGKVSRPAIGTKAAN